MPAIHSKIRHEFSNCTGTQLHSGDFSCVVIIILLLLYILDVNTPLITKFTLKTSIQETIIKFSLQLPKPGFVPSMLSNIAVCDYNIPE